MDKRDRFIAEFRGGEEPWSPIPGSTSEKEKGGHAMIFIGSKFATLPSREIDPKTAAKIRKALDLT